MIRMILGTCLLIIGSIICAIAVADVVAPFSVPPNRTGAVGGLVFTLTVIVLPGVLCILFGKRSRARRNQFSFTENRNQNTSGVSTRNQAGVPQKRRFPCTMLQRAAM
jgi:hypothetical protein